MKFGDILRELIEERNLTQKQVAHDLGVAASTMGGYVQNSSEPDFNTVRLFANYFNVSADYLLDLRTDKTDTRQEDELLRIFRSLTAEQRILYLEQGKAFFKINKKRDGKTIVV
ncbi:MAG: helix-turn-helix domain-containing protein [Oscillospiraceae bacterium]|nr:helix-turn-helix domain-containing protein [Oscillospiraceae bacterium]